MQGWRQPQPSGTNRPSSYPSHPRGRSACAWRVQLKKVESRIRGPASSLCGPQGTRKVPLQRGRHSRRQQTSAAHRSAAMAGGARPDPFRTRKLSRRAPMVLRGQPVGEQGAADRWTALDPHLAGSGAGAPRGCPRRPLLFILEGPPGPFFHGARARGYGIASSDCSFAGSMNPPIPGAGWPPFYGALSWLLEILLVRKHSSCRAPRARVHGSGRLRLHIASDDPFIYGSGVLRFAPFTDRSVSGGRSCRDLVRVSSSTLGCVG